MDGVLGKLTVPEDLKELTPWLRFGEWLHVRSGTRMGMGKYRIQERIRPLAEGGYLERSEPVLLVGEPSTGKTHLATGLAIAACRQRKRVRFTTAAALVNQLVEAQREQSIAGNR